MGSDDERREAIRDLETAHVEFLTVFHKVGFVCGQVAGKIDLQTPADTARAKAYVETGKQLADYLVEAADKLRQQLQVVEASRPFLPEPSGIIVPGRLSQ